MSAKSFEINSTKNRFGTVTIIRNINCLSVQLHRTVVVFQDKTNDIVTLNTGGWHTVTTKTAMNEALRQLGVKAYVSQKKGQWYVTIEGKTVEYFDKMKIGTFLGQLAVLN